MNIITQFRSASNLEKIVKCGFGCFQRNPELFYVRAPRRGRFFHTSAPKQNLFNRFIRKPTERTLKKRDDVPDEFTLIYRNGMGKYMFLAQSIMTVTAGLIVVIFCIKRDYSNMELRYEEWSSRTRKVENEEVIFISIFVVFVILLQTVIAKAPMRIYKVPGTPKYTIIFNGNLPFTTNKMTVERDNIYEIEPRGALPWRDNRYLLELKTEEKEVILFDQYFRRPADLAIMLGQQKDPDSRDQ